MNTKSLKDLASIIGWKLVNDDQGFSTYEYTQKQNKYEKLSHIVKISDEIEDDEMYEIWLALKSVLPKKLQKKLNKITHNVEPNNISTVIEVINFTIDEYKSKTTYSKVKEYGRYLGVNIEELGYDFEYEMPKNTELELVSQIETNLPIEIAPIIGKMKKIDYKIGYVKLLKRN